MIGRILKTSIHSKQGNLILPGNSLLNEHNLTLLERHGIDLSVEDTQFVADVIMEETISEIQMIFHKLHNQKKLLPNSQIQDRITPKIRYLCNNASLSCVIYELRKKDNYTYRHSVAVAVISYLIGKWLGFNDEKLNDLAIAGLLHDLGKMNIPDTILNKPGRLTADEYAEIKLHPRFGYEAIQKISGITEEKALVALQHHERENGSGYPFGITGQKISQFSKIVAVADVFHTMISQRVYKKPIPLYQVFLEIYHRAFGLFDPLVVQCFINNMMNRMIGDLVFLSDGKMARIVMIHPDDLLNPLVEAQGVFYDLRQTDTKITNFAANF